MVMLRLASPVERLEHDGAGVHVWSAARSQRFDRVVSTLPMRHLVALLGGAPPEVLGAVDALRVNPVAIVTIGVTRHRRAPAHRRRTSPTPASS